MKKVVLVLSFILLFSQGVSAESIKQYDTNMKRDILCIMMAYPEYVKDVASGEDGNIYIVMKSGRKIIYDDKRQKNSQQKFLEPDVQDMMEQIYPLDSIEEVMDEGCDPGRIRVYPILEEVYGGSKNSVEKKLKMANLGYKRFQFNGNNNASKSLENAVREAMSASKKEPRIGECLFPSSGTFNYRNISGTGLRSPHSFGIAIDLARDKRDYWKWVQKSEGSMRIKSYPKELVKIFEKNNFVWGGKWNHFDILHFEYRPEIILKSKYFGKSSNNDGKWYKNVPMDNDKVKSYVEKINKLSGYN